MAGAEVWLWCLVCSKAIQRLGRFGFGFQRASLRSLVTQGLGAPGCCRDHELQHRDASTGLPRQQGLLLLKLASSSSCGSRACSVTSSSSSYCDINKCPFSEVVVGLKCLFPRPLWGCWHTSRPAGREAIHSPKPARAPEGLGHCSQPHGGNVGVSCARSWAPCLGPLPVDEIQ